MDEKTAPQPHHSTGQAPSDPIEQTSSDTVIENTPHIKSQKSRSTLLYILVALAILILFALIVLIVLVVAQQPTTTSQPEEEQQQVQEEESTETEVESENQTEVIEILSPERDERVDGMITVSGRALASLQELTAEIYDGNNNLLATSIVGLASGDSDPIHAWEKVMSITSSPETVSGRIVVFPLSEDISSELTATQFITFSEQVSAGRLRLLAPLSNQSLVDTSVTFRGEMKDFFEGNLEVRLLTSAGTTIFQDFITAEGDNYGQFASFEKDIEFDEIPLAAGDEGIWELFETSAADGTETVLLTLPARFIE